MIQVAQAKSLGGLRVLSGRTAHWKEEILSSANRWTGSTWNFLSISLSHSQHHQHHHHPQGGRLRHLHHSGNAQEHLRLPSGAVSNISVCSFEWSFLTLQFGFYLFRHLLVCESFRVSCFANFEANRCPNFHLCLPFVSLTK